MARLVVQYLAIERNEKLPNNDFLVKESLQFCPIHKIHPKICQRL